MLPIGEGTFILTPFGLEYVLFLASLTVVAILSCDVPIAFQIRRQFLLLLDACRRIARRVGELAARMTNPSPPATLVLKSVLNRNLSRHS